MNIVIGHCYTAENKGDAAIVLATVALLRKHAPDARVVGMSTFSEADEAFKHHQGPFRAAGLEIVPAVLPEDKLHVGRYVLRGPLAKVVSFAKNSTGLGLRLALRRISARPKSAALQALASADIFVSKGGSFLYSLGGFRGDISLFKLLMPFYIARRGGARTIVLAQSLGPFRTAVSRRLFARALRYIDKIYVREQVCLKYLKFLAPAQLGNKIAFCPDLAFALDSVGFEPLDLDYSGDPIGLTIVNHKFPDSASRRRYIDTIARSIVYIRTLLPEAKFFIFPQVLSPHVDGSLDYELSDEVARACVDRTGIQLDVVKGDYDPRVLQQTYAKMRCFLATRLHSSIFSASMGVPTLVFGYHGSKAQGIWEDLGFANLFFDIEDHSWQQVQEAIDIIVSRRDQVRGSLLAQCKRHQHTIEKVISDELLQLGI